MPLTAHAKLRRDKDQRRAVNANMIMADMGGWALFKSLHAFTVEAVCADGPRMTEMRVRFGDGSEAPLLRLWASNGKGTPVDRVGELRAALNAANARLRALGEAA